ncbi:methyltransferase-like protein 25B [Mytilus galloprovincialis]|uniref:methyltransferase-like protein 25B n=1 Tax=Mytilus galloprovincialis TaxID=29158 RepID=UPI003F7C3691
MECFCCNNNSVQSLQSFHTNALNFIALYKTVADAYVSNFFVEDHWKKLPSSWKDVLCCMDTDELSDLLSVTSKHCRKVLPLSLLSFKSCTQTYSLGRSPVNLDSHKIKQTFQDNGRCDVMESNQSIPVPPVQLEVPDSLKSKHSVQDGQYLPMNQCFRKHIKPKKQHEILQLGKLISLLSQASGSKHVIDVGSGQGHLSRILTFGHSLKVTTVEASGCHAPKAAKFDKDMSYTIRSHLKRKLKESKTIDTTDETCAVDSIPLPNHVTCMIQPNTTPDDFLQVINSETSISNDDSLCQCPNHDPDDSLFRLQTCVKCNRKREISHLDKRLLLTGLHACGDLTPTILRVFARCDDIRGVASVGCCYMKISTKESASEDAGYPMSKFVSELPDHQLTYEAREMACHSLDVYRQRLLDNPPNLKLHCYRALLQELVLQKRPDFVFGATKLTIKKAEQMGFEKYAKIALDKLGLDCEIDSDMLKTLLSKLSNWKDVVAFYTIRLALAPVVETAILLDRMFYLQEQGISSYLIPVFDPSLSPRNFALVAYK